MKEIQPENEFAYAQSQIEDALPAHLTISDPTNYRLFRFCNLLIQMSTDIQTKQVYEHYHTINDESTGLEYKKKKLMNARKLSIIL